MNTKLFDFLTYFMAILGTIVSPLYIYFFANDSLIRNKYVLQSALLPKIDIKLIYYIFYFVFYLLCNILFMDQLHAMEPSFDIDEIKSTVQFYQNEVVAIQSAISDQGLNVDNSMLSPEQQAYKAEYLEALKDSKEALSSNISKLKDANLVDTSEVLGKRGADSNYANTSRKK